MKHVGIAIKFYNQIDVNSIDLDSNLVDLNYKVASLIFCYFWRSIPNPYNFPSLQFRRGKLLGFGQNASEIIP